MNAENAEEASAETRCARKADASNATREATNRETVQRKGLLQGHLPNPIAAAHPEAEEAGDIEETQRGTNAGREEVTAGASAEAQTGEESEAEAAEAPAEEGLILDAEVQATAASPSQVTEGMEGQCRNRHDRQVTERQRTMS